MLAISRLDLMRRSPRARWYATAALRLAGWRESSCAEVWLRRPATRVVRAYP
jgi:hypothetical protein